MSHNLSRRIAPFAGLLLAVYTLLSGFYYRWMLQPPGAFAAHMARLPAVLQYLVYFGLPTEPLWTVARGGRLHIGNPAPDFSLPQLGNKGQPEEPVRLSVYRGARPVVLVFGSYT